MKVEWQDVELKGNHTGGNSRLYIDGTFEVDNRHVCFIVYILGKGESNLYAFELIDGQIGDTVVLTDDEIEVYMDIADTAARDIRRKIDNILDDYCNY